MRGYFLVIFICLASMSYGQSEWVNPMIGTAATGHTFPAAVFPFGLVQVGPDTRVDGSWEGCSGYHYSDKTIYGFSHTHLSGTGCSDYGDVMLMPYVGEVPQVWNKGFYTSSFAHENEKAEPGYYAVLLDNGSIQCEMAASEHGAIHRYRFQGKQKGDTVHVVLDLSHRDELLASDIKRKGTNALMGFRTSKAWAQKQQVYFYIEADRPIWNTAFIKQEEMISCIVMSFVLQEDAAISLKVGISAVDEKGAEKNVLSEIKQFDFDQVRQASKAAWNKELAKISIGEASLADKTNFYTAFYHTMIHPNVFSDVDGRYRGRDNQIHYTDRKYYTVFSLWDTFRALHPLHTLINRERTQDFISTFLLEYQQGGRLPMWELWCNETDCMIGYHAVPVLADAMAKGIPMDSALSLEVAMSNANYDERSVPLYAKKGYLEIGDENESVAKTLEYAYDDWCIALMANYLNDDAATAAYLERSTAWMNLLDPATGLMRPRVNGGRLYPFDPREVNNHYTEANAWQYSFFVPHDIQRLIEAVGGAEKFEALLDQLFSEPTETTGRNQVDITGLIGQYAHGNEPSHHMAYLYNYINKPEKTARLVHEILTTLYKPTPDGLPGNEDCGQMSAWYVFSALGFYPVLPGSNYYAVGYPIFKESEIKFENGKSLKIHTEGNDGASFFLRNLMLNGRLLNRTWIRYDELMEGGVLHIQYGASPARKAQEAYPQVFRSQVFSAAPEIKPLSAQFKGEMKLLIQPFSKQDKVLYTVDGSDPKQNGLTYSGDTLRFTSQTTIRAVVMANNGYYSAEALARFIPFPHPERKVKILFPYSPQYSAGGDEGLIDGMNGDLNWRKGGWQGYQNTDFGVELDLGISMPVKELRIRFLQDMRAWILFPTKLHVEYLNENKKLIQSSDLDIPLQDKEERTMIYPAVLKENLTSVRYVKIVASNYDTLPSWHPGAGGKAFIFVDELSVE